MSENMASDLRHSPGTEEHDLFRQRLLTILEHRQNPQPTPELHDQIYEEINPDARKDSKTYTRGPIPELQKWAHDYMRYSQIPDTLEYLRRIGKVNRTEEENPGQGRATYYWTVKE